MRTSKIVIFLLLACLQMIAADHTQEIPLEIQEAKARYVQRVNLEGAQLAPLGEKHLFERKGNKCPGSKLKKKIAKEVFNILKTEQLGNISFREDKLSSYDKGGVCSAMALDFAARYNTICASIKNADKCRRQVEAMAPYYAYANTTFISVQTAYNTISIRDITPDEAEDDEVLDDELKWQKMASLANYNSLDLTPITPTIHVDEDAPDDSAQAIEAKELINALPDATYVIRMIEPGWTSKHEYYGHTIVFVKNKQLSILFDNAIGAVDITADPASEVYYQIAGWNIPEFRIYRAECKKGGCRNFSCNCCGS